MYKRPINRDRKGTRDAFALLFLCFYVAKEESKSHQKPEVIFFFLPFEEES